MWLWSCYMMQSLGQKKNVRSSFLVQDQSQAQSRAQQTYILDVARFPNTTTTLIAFRWAELDHLLIFIYSALVSRTQQNKNSKVSTSFSYSSFFDS